MLVRNTRAEEVRKGLMEDLRTGAVEAGHKLPNEQVLAQRFEVSRATIREAVGALVEGGYLVRRHGSGTYVTSQPSRRHALDTTLSYTQMIREAGMMPGQQVLSVNTRSARPEEVVDLDLAMEADVRVVERLRTADGRAVVFSIDRIPEQLVSGLPDDSFSLPLFDLLTQIGSPARAATAVLTPVIADARLARVLGVSRGTALQRIEEIDFGPAGKPVMVSSEWHVPGVFELRVNRRS